MQRSVRSVIATAGAPVAAGAGFFAFGFFFVAVFALSILSLVMLVVSVIDMARRPDWQWKIAGQEKVLWIVLVCLVNAFAIVSLIYWFHIRKKLIAVESAAASGQFGPGHMGFSGWEPGPGPQFPQGGAPPGWYPDPGGANANRYWDGYRWTEHLGQQPAPG